MTDTPGTLEERMKSRIADWHDEEAYEDWLSYQREYAEAADEIASLRARVEALELAIDPFARVARLNEPLAGDWPDDWPNDRFIPRAWPTWGDFKRADSATKPIKDTPVE